MILLISFLGLIVAVVGEVETLANALYDNCTNVRWEIYAPRCVQGRTGYADTIPGSCDATELTANFIPLRFYQINDQTEAFTMGGSIRFEWDIECVEFYLADDDISFKVDESKFFRPLIFHQNAASNFDMSGDSFASRLQAIYRTHPSLRPRPWIAFLFQRTGIFESTCSMDFANFPFDIQTCSIDFVIQENQLALRFDGKSTLKTPNFETFMSPGMGWTYMSSNHKTTWIDISGNRSAVKFEFSFRRKPDFYVYSLILPTCLLASLELIVFVLPPKLAERSNFSVTILLAFTFMQSLILQWIPPKPQRIFLSNYTDLMSLFAWFVTSYLLISCTLNKRLNRWQLAKRLTGFGSVGRLIDFVVFLISFVFFVSINIYAWRHSM